MRDDSRAPVQAEWSVALQSAEDGLTASVIGLADPGPWEFAFYLMCGRDRRTVHWYRPEPIASFAGPHGAGVYHAVGFVRRPGAKEGAFRRSGEIVVKARGYDPGAWRLPIHDHASVDAFSRLASVEDGVHRIGLRDRETLDLLVTGLAERPDAPALLVCFSAAVQHTSIAAPVFSGVKLSRQLGMPLVAVADPMLALHSDLNLAWYAGAQTLPALQQRIAAALDHLAALCGMPLVLFGGSGGGFAALSVLEHLKRAASAYVWNPQTSISRYYPVSVLAYARHAAPALAAALAPSADAITDALGRAGLEHDLTQAPRSSRHPVVYLQNRSDTFHVERHLSPFASANGLDLGCGGVRLSESAGLCVWLGDWGRGHVSPPGRITSAVLQGLAGGMSLRGLADWLGGRHEVPVPPAA